MLRMVMTLLIAVAAAGPGPDSWQRHLPRRTRVLDTARISSRHGERLLILWIADPQEHRTDIPPDEALTCPELASGRHYVHGHGRVSLIDVGRSAVINTVPLEAGPQSRTLDLPLDLAQTLYETSLGTSKIMHLRDTNADGRPDEFVIFAAESCSDRYGAVIGYSERHDRAVWYTFHLTVNNEGKVSREDHHWIPVGFFDTAPKEDVWRFTWRYPEDPPRKYRYEIRYNSAMEQFSGVETIVGDP